ncbi:MAG: hypothetical protein WC777_06030 [Candidatus Gracilibacteria bacterium]|jgi:hypothetical protein
MPNTQDMSETGDPIQGEYIKAEKLRNKEGADVGWIEYEGRRVLKQVVHNGSVFVVIDDREDAQTDITRFGIYIGKGASLKDAMQDLLTKLRENWEFAVRRDRRHAERELLDAARVATEKTLRENLGDEIADVVSITVQVVPISDQDDVLVSADEALPEYTPPEYSLREPLEA